MILFQKHEELHPDLGLRSNPRVYCTRHGVINLHLPQNSFEEAPFKEMPASQPATSRTTPKAPFPDQHEQAVNRNGDGDGATALQQTVVMMYQL